MPEPFTLVAAGLVKFLAAHAAATQTTTTVAAGTVTGVTATHFAALLFAGVVAGSILMAICNYLQRLVDGGAFTQKQAMKYKEKAKWADGKAQQKMEADAAALCAKYGL